MKLNDKIIDKIGTGRRKTAVSSVILRSYKDKVVAGTQTVNSRALDNYFPLPLQRESIMAPLKLLGKDGQYDIIIKVNGGGIEAQAIATRLAISRALLEASENDEVTRGELKKLGYLTRDSRKKERKKYGQKGARKRFQFSKR